MTLLSSEPIESLHYHSGAHLKSTDEGEGVSDSSESSKAERLDSALSVAGPSALQLRGQDVPTTDTGGIGYTEPAPAVLRSRQIPLSFAGDYQMALTLLSFIQSQEGGVRADNLMEWGERSRLFVLLLDLYDMGAIERDGSSLSISPRGVDILRRTGIDV